MIEVEEVLPSVIELLALWLSVIEYKGSAV